jgi:hypothetical protein
MPQNSQDPKSPLPFGAQSRRPAWPLAAWVAAFLAWLALLIYLAIRYPVRG